MRYTQELFKKLIGLNQGTEREMEIPFLLDNLPDPPLKILDVGCSYSNIIYELKNLGYDIYGIDMVQCDPPITNFYLGDARKMPYKDNEFDYVICISSLEHFGKVETPYHTDTIEDKDADIKTMREIYRVLKPKGRLILTLPVGYGEPHWYRWVKFYNTENLQSILNDFNTILIRYSYFDSSTGKWTLTDKETAENTYSTDKINANVSILLEKPNTDYDILNNLIKQIEFEPSQLFGEYLWHMFKPKSVIDVGCATGQYLIPFIKHRCKILGIDNEPTAGEFIKNNFENVDLRQSWKPKEKFDLAICLEVGEHLDCKYSKTLIETLKNCSDRIVFSAAHEGQSGFKHICCKNKDYWEKFFTGFQRNLKDEEFLLKLMDTNDFDNVWWLKENIMIFERIK